MTYQLPEPARAHLLALYLKHKTAEAEYTTAASATLRAFGLDPQDENQINLDTGVVTPAEPPKAAE